MAILTDTDIKQLLVFDGSQWNSDRQLLIESGEENCITPMGYDLRVGGFYKTLIGDPKLVDLDKKKLKKVIIKPGDIVLIGTLEKIKLPQDGSISALILSRVSQVSKGLSNISTKVDPGWAEGELLIPVQNFSRDTIELQYKEKLCTIVFFRNESQATEIYDSSSSRQKFFQLLAQTKRKSFSIDIAIEILTIFIVVISFILGYSFYKDTVALAVTVTVGITISRAISEIIRNWFNRN